MTSLVCLLPPVLDSIGKAIYIANIFFCPPLSATLACYGQLVLLMLPFTRTAETVELIRLFYNTIIDSTGVRKAKGCSQFFLCTCEKEGQSQSIE